MKVLIFAATPPPHHGQSYMAKLLLDGFGTVYPAAPPAWPGYDIDCYHIDAKLATDVTDMGRFRLGKMLSLLSYCLKAIYWRFRYNIKTFYYFPAPPLKGAVMRDWIIIALCRPFYKYTVFHWQASGLGEWLEEQDCIWMRRITFWLLSGPTLSIALAKFNEADAKKFRPIKSIVINNGIPDPCPEFDQSLRPQRRARALLINQALARHQALRVNVLYLALCTRDKGLHDAVIGVHIANQKLAAMNSPVRLHLQAAGTFLNPPEEQAFAELMAKPEIASCVSYLGFLQEDQKRNALAQADLFCFPTYYSAEGQPVSLIEAMAFGLPIVTTRWRSLPELFAPDYPGLVNIRAPEEVADALLRMMKVSCADEFRKRFLEHYTVNVYLSSVAAALRSIDAAPASTPQREPAASIH